MRDPAQARGGLASVRLSNDDAKTYCIDCHRSPRRPVRPRTGSECQTTSSHSTVSCVREATMRRRSSCVIGVTEDVTCFVYHLRWSKSQKASGCVLCVRQKMRMALLRGSSTAWMNSKRQPLHSRRIFLAAKLLQRRSVLYNTPRSIYNACGFPDKL